ncbi:MAG: hypothetical protein HY078_13585 [Elusimicrobia bacterium]|nr:hypothetical protein [Elusimicrobiota bacterium]
MKKRRRNFQLMAWAAFMTGLAGNKNFFLWTLPGSAAGGPKIEIAGSRWTAAGAPAAGSLN